MYHLENFERFWFHGCKVMPHLIYIHLHRYLTLTCSNRKKNSRTVFSLLAFSWNRGYRFWPILGWWLPFVDDESVFFFTTTPKGRDIIFSFFRREVNFFVSGQWTRKPWYSQVCQCLLRLTLFPGLYIYNNAERGFCSNHISETNMRFPSLLVQVGIPHANQSNDFEFDEFIYARN